MQPTAVFNATQDLDCCLEFLGHMTAVAAKETTNKVDSISIFMCLMVEVIIITLQSFATKTG